MTTLPTRPPSSTGGDASADKPTKVPDKESRLDWVSKTDEKIQKFWDATLTKLEYPKNEQASTKAIKDDIDVKVKKAVDAPAGIHSSKSKRKTAETKKINNDIFFYSSCYCYLIETDYVIYDIVRCQFLN